MGTRGPIIPRHKLCLGQTLGGVGASAGVAVVAAAAMRVVRLRSIDIMKSWISPISSGRKFRARFIHVGGSATGSGYGGSCVVCSRCAVGGWAW